MEVSFYQQYIPGLKVKLASILLRVRKISKGIASSSAAQLDRWYCIQGSVWQLSTRCSYSSVTFGRITSLTVPMHWAPMSLGAVGVEVLAFLLSVLSKKRGMWMAMMKILTGFTKMIRVWTKILALRLHWGQYARAADDERCFDDAWKIWDKGGGKLSVYTTMRSKDPTCPDWGASNVVRLCPVGQWVDVYIDFLHVGMFQFHRNCGSCRQK